MKLENEVCRKVYDHHGVLKGELGTVLLESCSRAKLDRDSIAAIVNAVSAAVDTSTDRMANDYQKLFKTAK